MKDKFSKYFVIFIPLILGGIIGIIIDTSSYQIVNKPSISPSGIVFPIVWSILYILMGISYYLTSRSRNIKSIYYLQLIVNLIWPILFFNFNLYLFSSLWIVLLIILVIGMIIRFYLDNKISGYLNLLYLGWLVFALYLNFSVYLLN